MVVFGSYYCYRSTIKRRRSRDFTLTQIKEIVSAGDPDDVEQMWGTEGKSKSSPRATGSPRGNPFASLRAAVAPLVAPPTRGAYAPVGARDDDDDEFGQLRAE